MTQPNSYPSSAITLETRNFLRFIGPAGRPRASVSSLVRTVRARRPCSLFWNSCVMPTSGRTPAAVDQIGGVYGLRSWAASDDEPVFVCLAVGDLRWELLLTAQGPTLSHRLGEQVIRGGEVFYPGHLWPTAWFSAVSTPDP